MPLSDAARAFLAEKRFAVLATISRDGLPHQTVMWYELRGDDIIMNTAAGRVKGPTSAPRNPCLDLCRGRLPIRHLSVG